MNYRTRAILGGSLLALASPAQALTYGLAGGNENWPADKRDAIIWAMDQAVATYNRYGYFDKHVTANYNAGVPTAQAGYNGWIDFGGSINPRVALHEIAHTMGVGTYWAWSGNSFTAANARVKLYDGQWGGIGYDAAHFWPYGLNFDSEDSSEVARERHVKVVAAMRWDMGIVWDSDGDAMPDDWEIFNFGNLSQPGNGDPDGDGVTNVEEYTSDSNPGRTGAVSGYTYRLRIQFSNKLVEVAGAGTADGGDVVQWTNNGGSNQQWTATHLGGGWFKFENANSGKVLETAGMGMNDGDNVQQWTWLNNYGQQWRLAEGGNGYWRICNRQSGKVLDVYGVNAADGANIVQWSDWAGPGQLIALDLPNVAPVFTANPLTKAAGVVGSAYSGTLAGSATDANATDTLTFSKIAGPAWLTVAANGALGGTPPSGSGGVNAFTVRVADQAGLYAETTLNVPVNHALPVGWTSADIGATGIAGSAGESYSSPGTFTVSGSGADIWDAADSFRFASQTLVGDGEIIARVTSITNTDPWAKAGIMIRDGVTTGAANVLMTTTASNGFSFQWRDTPNAGSNFTLGSATNPVPNNWVRLVRAGNVFTGYASANGTNWTQVGTATVAMNSSVSIGLAVTSHNNTALNTATFDNVAILSGLPSPWMTADVGATGLSGSTGYSAGAFTIKGAGTFGGTADGFRYAYQPLSADGSIIARISTLQNTGNSARVGIMIRDTLTNSSRMAALSVTGSGAYKWERRSTTGGSVTTTNSNSGTAPNIWVRLVRVGNTITASKSTNGTSWTTIGSATVTMAGNCYVGLAVASGSTSTLNTSVMTNVTAVP